MAATSLFIIRPSVSSPLLSSRNLQYGCLARSHRMVPAFSTSVLTIIYLIVLLSPPRDRCLSCVIPLDAPCPLHFCRLHCIHRGIIICWRGLLRECTVCFPEWTWAVYLHVWRLYSGVRSAGHVRCLGIVLSYMRDCESENEHTKI